MKQYLFILFSIVFVILLSCNKSATEPQEDPPGYQRDIPWPSLADSPWPMYRCDPQNTGRSKFSGSKSGEIYRTVPAYNTESSVSIGKDNTIYYFYKTTELNSSTIDGTSLWKTGLTQHSYSAPVVSKNNSIYIASISSIIALDSTGSIIWKYTPIEYPYFAMAGISLGLDGSLYFLDGYRNLTALNSDGTLKWTMKDDRFKTGSQTAMAFSPDGKTLYIQGFSVKLLAFDIESKSVKWTFGQYRNSAQYNLPVVDSYGNIYVLSNEADSTGVFLLYALASDGTVKWKYEIKNDPIFETENSPCLDRSGNIIFGSGSIYSVNYEGKLNWIYSLSGYYLSSPVSCDNEGNIYFAALKTLGEIKVYGLNKSGQLLWINTINSDRGSGPSLSITSDEKLIVPTFRDKNFYIFK